MSGTRTISKHDLSRGVPPSPRSPLQAIRTAVPLRPEPRSIPARLAGFGAAAAALGVGACLGLLDPGPSGTAEAALAGTGLGAITAALFRAAGTRPASLLALTSLVAPLLGVGAYLAGTDAPPPAESAAAFLLSGMATTPLLTIALTRGNLFDELGGRWFRRPRAVAFLHTIGRPLVPRDLRKLEPYHGDKPIVLVVLHHPSGRHDGTEVISIVARRRRASGLLARILPFTASAEPMLRPTMITREALELIRRSRGTLD
jgi:hypothetical protein